MIDPCAPVRLMPGALWRRFLATHPGWRAPLHVAVVVVGGLGCGPAAMVGLPAPTPYAARPALPWISPPGYLRESTVASAYPLGGYANGRLALGAGARSGLCCGGAANSDAGGGAGGGLSPTLTGEHERAHPTDTPEPGTLALFGTALALLAGMKYHYGRRTT